MLEGNRNYTDGLWDMPIQKTSLNLDNYEPPKQHGFIYANYTAERKLACMAMVP